MTTLDQILSADPIVAGRLAGSFPNWISSVGQWVATWVDTCADYYAAAAMYEQLSALSDAELMRKGTSRATLARDVLHATAVLNLEPGRQPSSATPPQGRGDARHMMSPSGTLQPCAIRGTAEALRKPTF